MSVLKIKDANGNWQDIITVKGDKGEDGFSPTATVTKDGTSTVITITDVNGTTTETIEVPETDVDLSEYATIEYVDDAIANIDIGDGGSGSNTAGIDLSNYYSKKDNVVENSDNNTLKLKYEFDVARNTELDSVYSPCGAPPLRIYNGTCTLTSNFTWDKMLICVDSKANTEIDIKEYTEVPYSDDIVVINPDEEQYIFDYIIINPKLKENPYGVYSHLPFVCKLEKGSDLRYFGTDPRFAEKGGAYKQYMYYSITSSCEYWRAPVYIDGELRNAYLFATDEMATRYVENNPGTYVITDDTVFDRPTYFFEYQCEGSSLQGESYTISAENALHIVGGEINANIQNTSSTYVFDYLIAGAKTTSLAIIIPEKDTNFSVVKGSTGVNPTAINYELTLSYRANPTAYTNTAIISSAFESDCYYRRSPQYQIVKFYNLDNLADNIDLSEYAKTEMLDDYYTKENTYNKEEIDSKLQSGGGGEVIYSSEETIVGTWIDGKPIYRKVFQLGTVCSGISNHSWATVPHGIQDVETWVTLKGIAQNGKSAIPIPYAATTAVTSASSTSALATNINSWVTGQTRFNVGESSIFITLNSYNSYVVHVTLEYTKTSN